MASSYGKGPYGCRLYSLTPDIDFSGDLAPSVGFSGALDVLAQGDVAGNLRSMIVLGGSLTVDHVLAGDMTLGIALAASAVFGPYWPPSQVLSVTAWGHPTLSDVAVDAGGAVRPCRLGGIGRWLTTRSTRLGRRRLIMVGLNLRLVGMMMLGVDF